MRKNIQNFNPPEGTESDDNDEPIMDGDASENSDTGESSEPNIESK